MKRTLFTLLILLNVSLIAKLNGQSALSMTWEEEGPNNIGSYIRSMAIDGGGTLWAGVVNGGLWKSNNEGQSWEHVSGIPDNLAISTISIEGSNIYLGTGDLYFYNFELGSERYWYSDLTALIKGFHNTYGYPGEGVIVSNDGGNTWTHDNGTWNSNSTPYEDDFMSIQKVVTRNGRTLIATLKGLYYSDDADLSTITKCNGTAHFQNEPVVDIEFGKANYVFAATADSIYMSTDNGLSFGQALNRAGVFSVDASPPYNRVGGARIEIEVAPSNPGVIYVAGVSNINERFTGLWRSIDDGQNWARLAPSSAGVLLPVSQGSVGSGRYNFAMAVSPDNADECWFGGQRLYSYTPQSGIIQTLSLNSPAFTGPTTPIHTILFDPNRSGWFYLAGDGMIIGTMDGGNSFVNRTRGIKGAHMYSVSAAVNHQIIAAERYSGLLRKYNPNNNSTQQQFGNLYPGNGTIGTARFSLVNPDNIIVEADELGLQRSVNGGDVFESFFGPPVAPIHPSISTDSTDIYIDRQNPDDEPPAIPVVYDGGNVLPPVNPWTLDEVLPASALGDDSLINEVESYLYFCSQKYVWLVTNPFGTLSQTPKWNRISGALVDGGASPKEYFTAIEASGDSNHVVYVGTNHGKIWRIYNAHDPVNMDIQQKIQRVDIMQGLPRRWITDFAFDPKDPNRMVVTYGGYGDSNSSLVYYTANALDQVNPVSFSAIGAGMNEILPVYTAAFHPDPRFDALLVGTEKGVFSTTSDLNATSIIWNNEGGGVISNVPVTDIYIRPYYRILTNTGYYYVRNNEVFIATNGRGIFRSASLVGTQEHISTLDMEVKLMPNPTSGQTAIQALFPEAMKMKWEAYDVQGRKIAESPSLTYPSGKHLIPVDATEWQSGIYCIRIKLSGTKDRGVKTLKAIVVQ